MAFKILKLWYNEFSFILISFKKIGWLEETDVRLVFDDL